MPKVSNTLVPYILSLIYAVPRVYRLAPTHLWHTYRFSCIRCLVTTVCHQHIRVVSCVSYVWCLVSTVYPQHTRVVLSVSASNSPISCNQLQLIAADTPNTFNIASPPDSNEAFSLTFCKHRHYLIWLTSFELSVTITLPPSSRQGIEIIPYIKRFLQWIEAHSLGGELQSKSVLHVAPPMTVTGMKIGKSEDGACTISQVHIHPAWPNFLFLRHGCSIAQWEQRWRGRRIPGLTFSVQSRCERK
jgi:hypothetical protein